MIRRIGKMAAVAAGAVCLAAGGLVGSATPALAGAATIQCSMVFPELGGTIVFTPNGQLLGNCWEHHHRPAGGSQGGSAEIVDCEDQIQPGSWVGIAVHTPQGGTYINCHLHIK